jgi:hypothetical protein
MTKQHAKLSASASMRWMLCPGSIKACEGMPEKSSIFADEGSAAHELAEMVLLGKISCADDWLNKPLIEHNTITAEQEMCDAVQSYVDYVESLKGDLFVEQRVDYSHIAPSGFGTADAILLDPDSEVIRIVDLKYGKGHKVDADYNTQMMLYAIGAVENFGFLYDDFEFVEMTICQPRLDHISEWNIPMEGLIKWSEYAAARANRALDDDAERVPGEKQCQWCLFKAQCPELKDFAEQAILAEFDNIGELSDVNKLTDDQISKILESKKLILTWLTAVEDYVVEKLESGETFTGYKLVAGRSLRQWSDDDQAEQELVRAVGDKAHTRKLISPAQAEKLLGKKHMTEIEHLVVKPEGKPTLAPESDKRPAVNVQEDDFKNLNLN